MSQPTTSVYEFKGTYSEEEELLSEPKVASDKSEDTAPLRLEPESLFKGPSIASAAKPAVPVEKPRQNPPLIEEQLPRVESLATTQRTELWRCDTARSLSYPILFWITRGQGRFMLDCKMRGVSANTAIYIPQDTLFSYEMFAQPQGLVVSLPRDNFAGFPTKTSVVKAANVQAQAEMGALIDMLQREITEERIGHNRAMQAHLLLLAVFIDRLLAVQPQNQLGKSDRVLQKFSHVVSIESHEGKSLGDFAADLNVTPTHLTRLTQESVGKPASTLVQERVINAACKALTRSDRPVQDIADDLGFSSPAYFTRAFQTHTGQSPSEFRKSKR